MVKLQWPGRPQWTMGEKIAFRFFFVYFVLFMAPWTWLNYIPGAYSITVYYNNLVDWMVEFSNKKIFHFFPALVYPNGSGDTSYNWTEITVYLLLAAVGCILWSIIDRRRAQYNRLAYWLRIMVRYFIIINCFGYGIIKLFSLQMPFPSLSQLATPLGDYLPMRLSWMHIGYSSRYQFFSGAMEVLAGLLMLYRKTNTFGVLLATGVFGNVMMLNMSYDIPVKLFSTHLFLMCLFLLAFEYRRIVDFFLLNKTAMASSAYDLPLAASWMRIGRIVLKSLFVLGVIIVPFFSARDRYIAITETPDTRPIRSGVYEVRTFVINGDTVPPLLYDSVRWKDIIFEKNYSGSVSTTDSSFRQRYGRGYFSYKTDSLNNIEFTKSLVSGESWPIFRLRFEMPDSNTVLLNGRIRQDSVAIALKRTARHFQLTERQFHWLSEYNR